MFLFALNLNKKPQHSKAIIYLLISTIINQTKQVREKIAELVNIEREGQ